MIFEVSQEIRAEWFNGQARDRFPGRHLTNLPPEAAHHPSPTYLRRHNEHRFQR